MSLCLGAVKPRSKGFVLGSVCLVGLIKKFVLSYQSPPFFAADFVVVAWMAVGVVVGSGALDGYELRTSIRTGLDITAARHVDRCFVSLSFFLCSIVEIVQSCVKFRRQKIRV